MNNAQQKIPTNNLTYAPKLAIRITARNGKIEKIFSQSNSIYYMIWKKHAFWKIKKNLYVHHMTKCCAGQLQYTKIRHDLIRYITQQCNTIRSQRAE